MEGCLLERLAGPIWTDLKLRTVVAGHVLGNFLATVVKLVHRAAIRKECSRASSVGYLGRGHDGQRKADQRDEDDEEHIDWSMLSLFVASGGSREADSGEIFVERKIIEG